METDSPPAWIADYPSLYAQFWPSERRQARLHAMGYDAYHLVGALFNVSETGIDEVVGATGQLFMTSDGRIHRRLAWAQFEGGQPVPLPDVNDFQDAPVDEGTIDATYLELPEPSPDD